VLGDEAIDRGAERKRANAQRVDVDAVGLQRIERLGHRRARRAEVDDAEARLARRLAQDRLRHELLRGLELLEQARDVVEVVGAGLE
jgi:hypothetical protein